MLDCNTCPHITITEEQQNALYKLGYNKSMMPHYCAKHNKRLFHKPYDEPMIHPCDECVQEMENK